MSYALYIASIVGAIALVMMMPRKGYAPRRFGALLGAFALGGLWLLLARHLPEQLGITQTAMAYYYVFSAIAIGAAARVITHTRPVFAALWFVMVVLASAGLFLVLSASFMAFAMVIIYGGAILVTYVFVIMLAAQSNDDANVASDYDASAREPVAAAAAGFLLLAVLLSVTFDLQRVSPQAPSLTPNPAAMAADDATLIETRLSERSADRMAARDDMDQRVALVSGAGQLENAERLGLDLFERHPLGLELAGVILLVSLIGAVVIARKRIEEPGAAQQA